MTRCFARMKSRVDYMVSGIWSDHRSTFKVHFLKTVNLSARTLISPDLQTRAYALTFNTLLSIVPAFALLLAISKGFGLQDLVRQELVDFFPSQKHVAQSLIQIVDTYLNETSKGIFLGVGILFLFYTVITLMSEIEDNFNKIWGVVDDRSMYQKLVDYLAVCVLVPVMLLCSIGLNIFMNETFRVHFHIPLLSPLFGILFDLAPFFLVCLAFTFSFYWIPHAKVKIKYAAISGVICGIAFQLLQLVFLNGQIMVSRYNAFYGSFAFLPLLLMFLWISWLIVLSGCVITYSAQYIFCFPFTKSIENVSEDYFTKVLTVVASFIAMRHIKNLPPLSEGDISEKCFLPIRLVNVAVKKLRKAGLIYNVTLPGRSVFDTGIVPAVELGDFTVGDLLKRLDNYGSKDFIPGFAKSYPEIVDTIDKIKESEYKFASDILLKDLALTLEKPFKENDTTE